MEPYQNFGGDSGVTEFEIGGGSITVQFNDGGKYLYTNESAGSDNIAAMQRLARLGEGLNRFINLEAKNRYEK